MVGLKIGANLHYQIHINKLPKRISSHQNAYQAAQMHIKPLRIVINSDPRMLATGQFHFANLHASDPHVFANFAFNPLAFIHFSFIHFALFYLLSLQINKSILGFHRFRNQILFNEPCAYILPGLHFLPTKHLTIFIHKWQ